MMSLWDALRMNMMISYQELVRTFLRSENNLILVQVIQRLVPLRRAMWLRGPSIGVCWPPAPPRRA